MITSQTNVMCNNLENRRDLESSIHHKTEDVPTQNQPQKIKEDLNKSKLPPKKKSTQINITEGNTTVS